MTNGAIHVFSNAKALGDHLEILLQDRGRIFILADSNTAEHCLPLIQHLLPEGGKDSMLMHITAGEEEKNIESALNLYGQLISYGADRESVLINLGGGMVCDLGGFVASTFKRGIDFIHIPTTVLAQVDAAIGGKTGVNLGSLKNMVGTFCQPKQTLIYPDFLNTLPKREVMSGFAEILKHALIADKELWKILTAASYVDLPLIKDVIPRALKIKSEIVQRDYKEGGERKKLNFGHTIGHALESLVLESPERDLLHGEAVALGMICESYLSMKAEGISPEEMEAICEFIASQFSAIELDRNQFHRVIELMRHDKKNKQSRINFTLLQGIGQAAVDQEPEMEHIMEALGFLERYPFPK